MKVDILQFQTFKCGQLEIHKFDPFNVGIHDITEDKHSSLKVEELDTVVVSAHKDGFKEVFLGEDSWYAIRMSSSMLDRVKYIASYQIAPVSAITYYAEVSRIEKYKDTNKYIIYFKNPTQKLKQSIKLDDNIKGLAPQAPRYTSFKKLIEAKKLSEVF